MKKLCCSVLLLIVFVLPRAAVAQTLTTVTGTISDPQNFKYTGARVTVTLAGTTGTVSTTPCPGNNLSAGCVVQLPSPFFTDSLTGKFTINLWANASIACAPVACPSTSYTFTVQSYGATANPPIGTGPQSFTVSGVVISGASQDISATISAGAPSLTNVGSAVSGVSSVFTRTGAVTAQLGDYNLSLINPGTAPAGTYNFGGSILLGSAIQDSGGFANILLGQHFATQYTVDTVMNAFLAVVPDAACATQDCVKLAPASSTSGIIGILNSTIGTAPSTGSIVQIGPSSWQIDNACSYGEAVIASSTAGEGHCTTTPGTNQVVAYTMISGISAGTYYVNVIAGQGIAGSTGGSSQPTDQQTVVNYTIPSIDFASGTSGAGTLLQRSNAAAMGDTLTDPTGAGSYIIISNCTGTTLQNGGAQCAAGTSALTVTRQTSALFYGPSSNVGSYGATTVTVSAGQKCYVHSLSATAWSVDGCSTIGGANAVMWQTLFTTGGAIGFTTNTLRGSVVNIGSPTTFSNIVFNVTVADNSADVYSFGLYSYSAGGTCTLVAHTAAASYTTTGVKRVATVEGSVTVQPGLYLYGKTGNANVLNVTESGADAFTPFAEGSTGVVTTSGNVPSSFTCPAATWALGQVDFFGIN